MGKDAKYKKDHQQIKRAQMLLPMEGLALTLRRTFQDLVFESGLQAVEMLLEAERMAACGPRYEHQEGRAAYRMGHTQGSMVLCGRKVCMKRPRARTVDGKEVVLPSWLGWSKEDPLNRRVVEQMTVGVSTRNYGRLLEPLPEELLEYGASKSEVSRRFVATTQKQLNTWLQRDLSSLQLVALMMDGIHVAGHVVLVALGIDLAGKKHVLGLWEGTTENEGSCKGLLQHLVDRGVRTDRSLLFVTDGAKGLINAIRAFWRDRGFIQRCQVHKKRNVLDHLPKEMHASVRATMNQAYASSHFDRAKRILTNAANRLSDAYPSAAASLQEGLEETLTLVKLGMPSQLAKTLSTTNPIENLNGTLRRVQRNVKRWRGGQMILRWAAVGVAEASRKFRTIKGYKSIPLLHQALQANDVQLEQKLDVQRKVA